MSGIVRKVHTKTSVAFGPVDKFADDLHVRRDVTNGSEGEIPDALAFLDDDGEMHVFVLPRNGREKLLTELLGKIHLPGAMLG